VADTLLHPTPISAALNNTLAVANWRKRAAEWLLTKAAEQDSNNVRWPEHAKAYATWRLIPQILRRTAEELTGKLQEKPDAWLIFFEDPDHGHEIFKGQGAEEAAHRRWEQARTHWTCHLFVRIVTR
jgi:hypothetical protein